MKKLLLVMLVIPFLLFGIVRAETTNTVLKNIWDSRSDLQIYFPDGYYHYDWSLEDWAREYGWKENNHLKQFNEEYEKDYIYEKYLPLERALDEIASKQYRENYNCVNFTEDLEKILIENDIASIKIIGRMPNQTPPELHEWIAIQFKPQTGEILKVSENYKVITTIK